MIKALRSLPRVVWLIGLISLINDSASEMLNPLVQPYLAYGLFYFLMGIMLSPASVLFGWLYQYLSPLAAILLLAWVRPDRQPDGERSLER